MYRGMTVSRCVAWLAAVMLAAGCGYRGPLHKTVITEDPAQFTSVREDYRELAALVTTDTGMPPTDSNTVSILPDQHQKWEVMKRDLEGARESVYIEQYRFCQDSCGTIVAGILKERSADGADVRVIVDKASTYPKDRKPLRELRRDSIDVRMFKACGNRDHRKIVLVDGKTGYVGGRNIADKYFRDWRDTDFRLNGLAVRDLGSVYEENQERVAPGLTPVTVTAESSVAAVRDTVPGLVQYHGKTVQIIHDNPWDRKLPVRNSFEWVVLHARRYFYYYSPYSPPPRSVINALKAAAARGVDVRWIVPENSDVLVEKWMGESLYLELLSAGVRIYEWQKTMMHTKQFICDDYITSVGSANVDNLSFFINLEVQALVYDEELARSARDLFLQETLSRCREVTLPEVRRWSIFRILRNCLTRVIGGWIS